MGLIGERVKSEDWALGALAPTGSFDDITNKNGHFYVCGDVRMAADVENTFGNGLIKYGDMDREKA